MVGYSRLKVAFPSSAIVAGNGCSNQVQQPALPIDVSSCCINQLMIRESQPVYESQALICQWS